MSLQETAKFTVEIVLSTKGDGELPVDESVEWTIATGLARQFHPDFIDVLAVQVVGRTGEL